MQPTFQNLEVNRDSHTMLCYEVKSPSFGFHWHYHPEIEISYVKKGYGLKLVGDQVLSFKQGDLMMLGSELPHTLISDDSFNLSAEMMEVVVIQFDVRKLLPSQSNTEELIGVQNLLAKSSRGLAFKLEEGTHVVSKLLALISMEGFSKYIGLLEILHLLGQLKYEYMASEFYVSHKGIETESRIRKVCAYIHEHYSQTIRIADLANLANMNASAFCRFFKKMTGITAIQYINQLRIGKACRLLQNNKDPISHIAYESGFNNLPHFSRFFQKVKSCSPSRYRQQFQEL